MRPSVTDAGRFSFSLCRVVVCCCRCGRDWGCGRSCGGSGGGLEGGTCCRCGGGGSGGCGRLAVDTGWNQRQYTKINKHQLWTMHTHTHTCLMDEGIHVMSAKDADQARQYNGTVMSQQQYGFN